MRARDRGDLRSRPPVTSPRALHALGVLPYTAS